MLKLLRSVKILSRHAFTAGVSALLMLSSAPAQQGGAWGNGFAQGVEEHIVENGPGNQFNVSCNVSSSVAETGILIYVLGKPAPANSQVNIILDAEQYTFNTDQSGTIETKSHVDADNFNAFLKQLKSARTMLVQLADGRTSKFSTRGAAQSFANRECKPAFAGPPTAAQKTQKSLAPIAGQTANQGNGPSFDCAKAQTPVEKTICSDPKLAKLDKQILDLYRQALATQSDTTQLKQTQAVWRKLRTSCGDVTCLFQVYSARASMLQQIIASAPAVPASTAPQPAVAQAQTQSKTSSEYIVTLPPGNKGLRLRNGPSTANDILQLLPANTAVTVLKRQNDGWWNVRENLSGAEGWVLSAQNGVTFLQDAALQNLEPTLTPEIEKKIVAYVHDHYYPCWSRSNQTATNDFAPLIEFHLTPEGMLSSPPKLLSKPSNPSENLIAQYAIKAIEECSPIEIPAEFKPYYSAALRDITIQLQTLSSSERVTKEKDSSGPTGSGAMEPVEQNVENAVQEAQSAETNGSAENPPRYRAVLTCSTGYSSIVVYACFIGGKNQLWGTLKIANMGRETVFTAPMMANDLSRPEVVLNLGESFEIFAQPNGSRNVVLEVKVIDKDGKVVSQKQASQYDAIAITNEGLTLNQGEQNISQGQIQPRKNNKVEFEVTGNEAQARGTPQITALGGHESDFVNISAILGFALIGAALVLAVRYSLRKSSSKQYADDWSMPEMDVHSGKTGANSDAKSQIQLNVEIESESREIGGDASRNKPKPPENICEEQTHSNPIVQGHVDAPYAKLNQDPSLRNLGLNTNFSDISDNPNTEKKTRHRNRTIVYFASAALMIGVAFYFYFGSNSGNIEFERMLQKYADMVKIYEDAAAKESVCMADAMGVLTTVAAEVQSIKGEIDTQQKSKATISPEQIRRYSDLSSRLFRASAELQRKIRPC